MLQGSDAYFILKFTQVKLNPDTFTLQLTSSS